MTFDPQAMAIWKDHLYLPMVRSSDIIVYNVEPFACKETIKVGDLTRPSDIVATEDVLYVSEFKEVIHRIPFQGGTKVPNWTVDGINLKLSTDENGNVIVTSWDPDKIYEYTSDGTFVRDIVADRFDKNLIGLQHAIHLEGDKFLVCHAQDDLHRVCMIDATEFVIRCHGGDPGSGMGQLNMPSYLAINRDGFIFVADRENNRIVQLNPFLEYVSETTGVDRPHRILLDEERGKLYAMEFSNSTIVVFDI